MAIFHRARRQHQHQQQQQPSMTPRCSLAKVIVSITVLLLASSGLPIVQAGRDKDATGTPIPIPVLGTQWPSPRPTTMRPKETPTPMVPMEAPAPIVQPTTQPTAQPTVSPGPTGQPTVTVAVALPQMRFVLEATGPLDEQQVDAAVVDFLNYFFSQGFYRDAFLYVTLQTSLMDGVGARRKTMRRHLTLKPTHRRTSRSMAAVEIVALDVNDGRATYNPNTPASDGKPAPVPTEEELSAIVSAYFSLWGAEKLLEYFQNDGLPVTSVSQVVIDGEAILMEEDEEQDGGDDSGTNNVGILAGCIAGAGALIIVAVAVLVHIRRRKKSAQFEVDSCEVGDNNDSSNQNKTTKMPVPSKSERSVSEGEGALPPPLPQQSSSAIPAEYQEKMANPYADSTALAISMAPTRTTSEDDQDSVSESDGDIISVAESLHHQHDRGPLVAKGAIDGSTNFTDLRHLATTGKASVRQQPPTAPQPNFQYDASRLDQVIFDAKKQGLSEK